MTFFALAFLIGMSHALEADHVAAVGAMATRQRSFKHIVRTGAVWGVGHTLTLMIFAGASLALGLAISSGLAGWLEFAVGVMLAGLGGQVLYRLVRDRVHFHLHTHEGRPHFHAHSHAGEPVAEHDPAHHDHDHAPFPYRALAVGMMHGMAGSAALLVLTASAQPTVLDGLGYVVVFGVGSILGMASLSAVMAVPLAYGARLLTWGHRAVHAAIGLATVSLGLWTMYETQARTWFG